MSLHYPGYNKAVENVRAMELPDLLALIDDLYGRDNLKYGDDVEDVRAEALRQIDREFTDTTSREFETVQFFGAMREAEGRP